MKIVSIHQPHYHTWLGLLHKIALSDLHIVLDDVQYRKRYFHNRAQYSSDKGPKILSLPVNNKGFQEDATKINEIIISSNKVLEKHYKTLTHRYGKTQGWPVVEKELERICCSGNSRLIDINVSLLKLTLKCFEIKTPLKLASDITVTSKKNQRLIDLCMAVDCDVYLSGNGARKYMQNTMFEDAGIKVEYQNFAHPYYEQNLKREFVSACIALDWFCIEPEKSVAYFQRLNAEINHEIHGSESGEKINAVY